MPKPSSQVARDLHRCTPPTAIKAAHSCATSPPTHTLDRVNSTQAHHLRHPNPHSARRTTNVPIPAVSSLGGFRTPADSARRTACMRPASETLHRSRHSHLPGTRLDNVFSDLGTLPTKILLCASCRRAHWRRPESRQRAHISVVTGSTRIFYCTSRNKRFNFACCPRLTE
jgi:hypothetical protein